MINLIPPDAHKQVKHEYWMRVITVWIILCGSAFLIVAIMYAPVYVLVRSQLSSFEEEYKNANKEEISFKESETAIGNANDIAKLLGNTDTNESFTELIAEIEALSGEGIAITEFTLSREDAEINPVVISGEAESRLILAEFRDAIEASPLFESVTLPLSNLAKDKDVPFSITLALSKDEQQ